MLFVSVSCITSGLVSVERWNRKLTRDCQDNFEKLRNLQHKKRKIGICNLRIFFATRKAPLKFVGANKLL